MKVNLNKDVITLLNSIVKNHKSDPIPKNITLGEFRAELIPTDNIVSHPANGEFEVVIDRSDKRIQAAKKLLNATRTTNAILYPPLSQMKWHTNSDIVGRRIYYTYTDGLAIFRYKDINGDIKEDVDNIGWTARSFEVGSDHLFWHSVWTENKRFAFGFNICP